MSGGVSGGVSGVRVVGTATELRDALTRALLRRGTTVEPETSPAPAGSTWWLPGGELVGPDPSATDLADAGRIAAAVTGGATSRLHVVLGPGHDRAGAVAAAALEDLLTRCAAGAVRCSVFRLPATTGDSGTWPRLQRELHALRADLEARWPGYTGQHPLRLPFPAGATLDLLPAGHAAAELLRLADSGPAGSDPRRPLVVPGAVPVPEVDLREVLAQAYELLLAEGEEPVVGSLDRVVAARLGWLRTCWGDPAATPADGLDAAERAELLAGARRSRSRLDDEQDRRRAGVTRTWAAAEHRRAPGRRTVDYVAAGTSGPPLVLVNALGQGLGYWQPLVAALAPRRVLVWTMDDTCGLDGQVDDLEAVLRAEGADRCDLLAWCTGAKVALRFQRRRPEAVRGILVLAGDFKHDTRPADLDAPYERHLDTVCRTLARQPALAGRMVLLFAPPEDESAGPAGRRDPAEVPALPYRALAAEIRRPFGTAGQLLAYARQLVDFWSHDETEAAAVCCPLLFLIGELDEIVSPLGERDAAGRFPGAWRAEVAGGTHYLMYERPELVAAVATDFFGAPRSEPRRRADLRWTRSPVPADAGLSS